MLFIHPMWFDESQRIGKQKCTPIGYALHVIADLVGLLGLVFLIVTPEVMIGKWILGTFRASLFWLMAVGLGLGIVSEALYQFSWWLAMKRGFQYDYELREASWIERGGRRTYRWPADDRPKS